MNEVAFAPDDDQEWARDGETYSVARQSVLRPWLGEALAVSGQLAVAIELRLWATLLSSGHYTRYCGSPAWN